MAKLQCELRGRFDAIVNTIESGIVNSGVSASKEDSSSFYGENSRCTVLVFERYSMLGDNRVSLNVTLYETGDHIYMSAIAAGGSQAMLFKLNTFGESAFLDVLKKVIKPFQLY